MQDDGRVYRELIGAYPLTDLTNRAERVSAGSAKLWLAGVDDLWWGKPDLAAALREVPENAAVVLLSHNPDFAEESPDSRVGLVLSGHMHGGQIYLPALGLNWQPSRYGSKYRRGLVQGPASQVYITCGVGTAGVPLRLNCPPEMNLLTLVPASST
jgi:predicted MPP superfamily phosphohydrolase